MRDIRISLNHDTLEYEVEEVRGGHLRTYASTEKNHNAVLYAKMEIEKKQNWSMAWTQGKQSISA